MSETYTFVLENQELLSEAEDIVFNFQNEIDLYFYQFFNLEVVKQFWGKLF